MIISQHTYSNGTKELIIRHVSGQEIRLLSIGATLKRWLTIDQIDIVAGYESIDDYALPGMFLGTNVGLVAGRLDNSQFLIHGKFYQLHSHSESFLHGGDDSIAFRQFDDFIIKNDDDETIIQFRNTYQNAQLPGIQSLLITYSIKLNHLSVIYDVSSTEPCPCNITNHSYFNLNGTFDKPIENHMLWLSSSSVVEVDDHMIGRSILPVTNTPFDFTQSSLIMDRVNELKKTHSRTKGIDHFYILKGDHENPTIKLSSSTSHKTLWITTDYPGVTVYTTNYPSLKKLHNHYPMTQHGAICLEAQYQSNAINDSRFSAGIVEPERSYHQEIHYVLRGE